MEIHIYPTLLWLRPAATGSAQQMVTEKLLRKQTGEALGVDLSSKKAHIRTVVRA